MTWLALSYLHHTVQDRRKSIYTAIMARAYPALRMHTYAVVYSGHTMERNRQVWAILSRFPFPFFLFLPLFLFLRRVSV